MSTNTLTLTHVVCLRPATSCVYNCLHLSFCHPFLHVCCCHYHQAAVCGCVGLVCGLLLETTLLILRTNMPQPLDQKYAHLLDKSWDQKQPQQEKKGGPTTKQQHKQSQDAGGNKAAAATAAAGANGSTNKQQLRRRRAA